MKGLCESGCGGTVKVYGCKWCPDCYPNFSAGQSLKERAFIVVAGKYEMDMEEGLTENCKFSSDVLTLDEAEKTLHEYRSYPFARIEYIGDQIGVIYLDKSKLAVNQCDGCNAGMYKDVQGMHRDENSNPIMVCQGYKYA